MGDDWWYPHDLGNPHSLMTGYSRSAPKSRAGPSGPVADIPTSRRPRRSLQRCFFWVYILTEPGYNLEATYRIRDMIYTK